MDKPKSLADELTALAEWLACDGWNSSLPVMREKAADVHAMAERVRGKVFSKPLVLPSTVYYYIAAIDYRDHTKYGYGDTTEDAIAHLQSFLDQQKG